MTLYEKILNKQPGILFYGLTPPKEQTPLDKIKEIALKHVERISDLPIDGLILYDIQDEKERTDKERPFPFMKTLDPSYYSSQLLERLKLPKILYQCVSKHTEESFKDWIFNNCGTNDFSVFVGAASKNQKVYLTMEKAYEIRKNVCSPGILGGVVIPERHLNKQDEHIRMVDKVSKGCSFFVSQAVYNIEASKNMLSDYYYYCQQYNIPMVPIIITLTPCGSVKSLQFMDWLGISIPKWLENELKFSGNILDKSIEVCKDTFLHLSDFCREKKIPLGFNIESIAIRREEIEASIELLKFISGKTSRQV